MNHHELNFAWQHTPSSVSEINEILHVWNTSLGIFPDMIHDCHAGSVHPLVITTAHPCLLPPKQMSSTSVTSVNNSLFITQNAIPSELGVNDYIMKCFVSQTVYGVGGCCHVGSCSVSWTCRCPQQCQLRLLDHLVWY